MMLGSAIRAAVTRGAIGFAGALCLVAAVGFLTVAAWLVLSEMGDTLFAAQVIGLVFLGLGLVLSFAAWRSTPSRAAHRKEPDPMLRVMEAFVVGLDAGRNAQRK